MHIGTSDQQKIWLAVAEYGAALEKTGTRALPGSGTSVWVSYEKGSMQRMPTFYSAPPAPDEVRRVLWNGRAGVVSYLVDADEHHPANAWLYNCRDLDYSVDKLSKPARRDARRAQRSLQFSPIELPALLGHGFSAYNQTRSRVGLLDGTRQQFERRFKSFAQNPFHHFVGAWKGDALLAFMSLIVGGDWVEIQGSFSCQTQRDLCPNDGLVNYVLHHYLIENKFKIISYGLSSIQEDADKAGLHFFKKKVGFEARLVHRAFVLHPLLRPIVNRWTRGIARTALRLCPERRLLRKAAGVLDCIFESKRLPQRI